MHHAPQLPQYRCRNLTMYQPPLLLLTSCSTVQIDPNDYLDNGIIENYDAWENAWQTAMRQLHVGTLNKHTRGGTRISTPRLHSSGLKSSFIQKGEMETEPEPEPGVIMHPLLCLGINLC